MVRPIICAMFLLFAICSLANAGMYLDFSMHQYHRLEPVERFQVDTRIRVHYETERDRYGLEYILFEEIDGPVSDHTLNLYELYWGRGVFRASAMVVLDGPYDKADPYYGAQLEFKANLPLLRSTWTAELVPAARIDAATGKYEPILGLTLRRTLGSATVELGYNAVELRDRYLITGTNPIAVASVKLPLWNGNRFIVEYGHLFGRTGPERHWWTWRLEFGHLVEF